jgi:hypothetical protein
VTARGPLCVAAVLLWSCTAIVPARAETYAPATISVSELFRRARAAEGERSPGAYHIVMNAVIDGEPLVEETFSDERGYKTTETIAGSVSSWGEFQGESWYQNANGFVQHVSGAYAQHDPLERAVRTMGSASNSATLLGMSAGTPAMYVVRVAPREGLSETRYYDASTYLLQKIELKDYDGRTRVSQYGDYRKVAGRMVPFLRTYDADFAKIPRRYVVTTYEAVRPGLANLSIPQSRTLFGLQGSQPVTIPAEFTTDGIIVRMNVGQRGLDMLLDTGSSSIVVNAAVASDLRLALHDKHVESFGGLFAIANARINDVSVGPLHAPAADIQVAPVDDDVAPTKRVVGLLGCDFIASGALEVNFQHKTLTLYPAAPANLEAEGWTAVPITLDSCVPLVKASFSGLPGQFVMDLGAYSTVLYEHYFSQFPGNKTPAHGNPAIESGIFIGGDEVRFQEFSMKTLGIGNLLFADALVDVPLTKKVQARDYDGLLGRPTLSNFNILFDYAHARVYLKPIL